MKFLVCCTLAVLIVACASAATINSETRNSEKNATAKATSHSLIIGKRQINDKLMYQANISKPASIIGQKVIHEVTVHAQKDHFLTEIRALDMATDGNGAFVVVTSGGPGEESVSLRFKSQRFHGINFIIQIFSKSRY